MKKRCYITIFSAPFIERTHSLVRGEFVSALQETPVFVFLFSLVFGTEICLLGWLLTRHLSYCLFLFCDIRTCHYCAMIVGKNSNPLLHRHIYNYITTGCVAATYLTSASLIVHKPQNRHILLRVLSV